MVRKVRRAAYPFRIDQPGRLIVARVMASTAGVHRNSFTDGVDTTSPCVVVPSATAVARRKRMRTTESGRRDDVN